MFDTILISTIKNILKWQPNFENSKLGLPREGLSAIKLSRLQIIRWLPQINQIGHGTAPGIRIRLQEIFYR